MATRIIKIIGHAGICDARTNPPTPIDDYVDFETFCKVDDEFDNNFEENLRKYFIEAFIGEHTLHNRLLAADDEITIDIDELNWQEINSLDIINVESGVDNFELAWKCLNNYAYDVESNFYEVYKRVLRAPNTCIVAMVTESRSETPLSVVVLIKNEKGSGYVLRYYAPFARINDPMTVEFVRKCMNWYGIKKEQIEIFHEMSGDVMMHKLLGKPIYPSINFRAEEVKNYVEGRISAEQLLNDRIESKRDLISIPINEASFMQAFWAGETGMKLTDDRSLFQGKVIIFGKPLEEIKKRK